MLFTADEEADRYLCCGLIPSSKAAKRDASKWVQVRTPGMHTHNTGTYTADNTANILPRKAEGGPECARGYLLTFCSTRPFTCYFTRPLTIFY